MVVVHVAFPTMEMLRRVVMMMGMVLVWLGMVHVVVMKMVIMMMVVMVTMAVNCTSVILI